MLKHTDFKKGVRVIFNNEPYEILESHIMKKAQRRVVIQTKIKNLINSKVLSHNFHQGDVLDKAELIFQPAKFIYKHKDKYIFSEIDNPSKRFELLPSQVGQSALYLKANQEIKLVLFDDKIVGIDLPIKIILKVTDSPLSLSGERAQAGTKPAVLETGGKIEVPPFIKTDDLIEVNTQTNSYVRRVQSK